MAKRTQARKKSRNNDGWVAAAGAGCLSFFILLKLAMIGGAFYLAYLVVSWLITK